jgi:hypothetical protein
MKRKVECNVPCATGKGKHAEIFVRKKARPVKVGLLGRVEGVPRV